MLFLSAWSLVLSREQSERMTALESDRRSMGLTLVQRCGFHRRLMTTQCWCGQRVLITR